MKMTPMQKYAMRLLIADGRIPAPTNADWQNMTREAADEKLSKFGGLHSAIEQSPHPERKTREIAEVSARSENKPVKRNKSKLEL